MPHSDYALLYPVLTLAGWTFVVLIWLAATRIGAGLRGTVRPADFRFGERQGIPEHIGIPNRNFMNLLELPVLFYVLSLVIYVARLPVPMAVTLAWAYVGLRVVHSLVHLTYNDVMHRLVVFAASNAALVTLWVLTLRTLMA